MIRRERIRDLGLVLAGVVVGGLLCGRPESAVARQQARHENTFVSAITQRKDMIDQLRLLNQQVAVQTKYLQSGKLKVVVEMPDEPKPKP